MGMQGQSFPLARGGHLCHLFRGWNDQKSVILPFVRQGIEAGEHCIYITSRQSIDDWCIEMQAFGIDVARARQSGALSILGKEAWVPPGINFNPIGKAREAVELINRLLQDFSGIRIAGDAAWAQDPDLSVDQVCHWESAAELVYEGQDVRAICQYNLDEQSPAAVHTALKTHRWVMFQGQLRENPFYDVPRILEREPHLYYSDADAASVGEMLTQLTTGA
jgi:hypothetical protein